MINEASRLEAVNRFIKPEESIASDLNDITALIAQICDTPVALITLIDDDTQWFKANVGIDMKSVPRELAFCNYTIQQSELLVVPDLSLDERFSSNPLVISNPNARFYAASPLVTDDGYAIGSLCVVDFKPKLLTQQQQRALKVLSKQVINLMQLDWSLRSVEYHHKNAEMQKMLIEDSQLKLKAIFDSSTDCHLLVSKQLEIIALNKASSNYFYNIYQKHLVPGDSILDFVDDAMAPKVLKHLLSALNGQSFKKELLMHADTPYSAWREINFVPIKKDESGEIIGIAINSADITQRKIQEEQIRVQNEALTRIAIIQSHELRRPVASLLGIMEIMRVEHSESVSGNYFNMMQNVVNELDEKIRLIVKNSEETIQEHLSIVA